MSESTTGGGCRPPGFLGKYLEPSPPEVWEGQSTYAGERCLGQWESRHYHVRLFEAPGGVRRLTIVRWNGPGTRWRADMTWDELMQVKADVGLGDAWAVEVYPPTLHRVQDVNARHLWLLPDAPPYAWQAQPIPEQLVNEVNASAKLRAAAGIPRGLRDDLR